MPIDALLPSIIDGLKGVVPAIRDTECNVFQAHSLRVTGINQYAFCYLGFCSPINKRLGCLKPVGRTALIEACATIVVRRACATKGREIRRLISWMAGAGSVSIARTVSVYYN